jgi:DNA replication protein DnaC
MAQGLSELLAEQSHRPSLPEDWLKHLIQAEQTDRQARALRYQLKAARFPIHRDLASFDFAESPLSEPRIRQLATASFTGTAHNLIFVGGTGTGKTHLAIALGVAAVHAGQRVRFYNVVDLVNQLEQEKQLGLALERSHAVSPKSMRCSSMSWAICRSPRAGVPCCFIL